MARRSNSNTRSGQTVNVATVNNDAAKILEQILKGKPQKRGSVAGRRRSLNSQRTGPLSTPSAANSASHSSRSTETSINVVARCSTNKTYPSDNLFHEASKVPDTVKRKRSAWKGAKDRMLSLTRRGKKKSFTVTASAEDTSSQESVAGRPTRKSRRLARVTETVTVSLDEADSVYHHGSLEVDGVDQPDTCPPESASGQTSPGGGITSMFRKIFRRSKQKKGSADSDRIEYEIRSRRTVFSDGYQTRLAESTVVAYDSVDFGGNTPAPTEQSQEDIINEVAARLGEIGDNLMVTRQQDLPTVEITYDSFESMVGVEQVSSWKQVAKVFQVAKHIVNTVGAGTDMVNHVTELTLRFIENKCAGWIADNGGFENILQHDDPDNELD